MSDLFTNQSGNEAQNADKKLMDRREGEISKGKLPGVYYEKSPLISWLKAFCGTIGSTRENQSRGRKGVQMY
jgi:hypothetical protein